MKLYILGHSKDDKGAQFEELTETILKQNGFSFVCRNYICPEGHEIDVQAKFVSEVAGKQTEAPVVCECKAHDNPIVISR